MLLPAPLSGARHAQLDLTVFLHRLHNVLAHLVHVEKVSAVALACHPANLLHGSLHSFQRQMRTRLWH